VLDTPMLTLVSGIYAAAFPNLVIDRV